MRTEILAPAGGREQLTAAVRTGADAVYLGTKSFNARGNAENIDASELGQLVRNCHVRGVKVFVTVNTLLTDAELPAMERLSDQIAESGADGVIIQDMAVFRLFQSRHPAVRRVASTQAAVHNVASARFMQALGYDRIVLARELSLAEIEKICRSVEIETEVFVHGAMCMCVSGMCYLSSMLGGRSGNRGLCAQPCRLEFSSGKRPYALSLKDMSYLSSVGELERLGVTSLKIEGRMKRPEYVAAAVTACRQALDGKPYDAQTLRAVFSRSGFSDGYLRGERSLDMFGYRRREDVSAAGEVLSGLSALYREEPQILDTDMALSLRAGQASCLQASSRGETVQVQGAAPQIARTSPTTYDKALRSLQKTGGTPFRLASLSLQNTENLMLPASELNALRRGALEALTERLGRTPPRARGDFSFPEPVLHVPHGPRALWARFERAQQICKAEELEKIILPLAEIDRRPELIAQLGEKLVGEAPALAFPEYEEKVLGLLQKLYQQGLRQISAENIYAIALGKQLGYRVHGGAALNILNTEALRFYAEQGLETATLSFELSMRKIEEIGGELPRGILAYGRLPLMRMRNCPGKSPQGCAGCDGRSRVLTDRKKTDFPLLCMQRRYTTLLNSVPLHIADRPIANRLDMLVLYFTLESPAHCEHVIEDYVNCSPSTDFRTGGLYYRNLL